MPIRPENLARYPSNWREIRARMMDRADRRCEWPGCGLGDGWIGYRDDNDNFVMLAEKGRKSDVADGNGFYAGHKVIRITLTCAHVDHIPEHCEPNNLRMWCQRHHLRHDQQHHIETAYATRRARACTLDMFATRD